MAAFVYYVLLLALCPARGSGQLFTGLKDILADWRNYLSSGLDALRRIAETIDTVEQFVDAAIEDECEPFICPPGTDRVPVVGHVPSSNGCGSFGLEWKADSLPLEELQDCCSLHDLCYDNCGSDKDACDIEFKKCLYAVCSRRADDLSLLKLKACKGSAKLMYTGTLALGCKAYQQAQEGACWCRPRQEL